MTNFPGERERVEELQARLKNEFSLARRILGFWSTRSWYPHADRCSLGNFPVGMAMLLNVQACRQYRAAVDLCHRGEAECAHIIGRSLSETLATCFVLLPNVRLEPITVVDKKGNQRIDPAGKPMY